MKKIAILVFILIQVSASSQITFDIKGIVINKSIKTSSESGSTIPIGTKIILKSSIRDEFGNKRISIQFNDKNEVIDNNQFEKINFTPTSLKEFWQCQALKNQTFDNLLKKGFQYKLRSELEDDAIEYLNRLKNNNLCFDDSYLESYIYSLVYRIYPSSLEDGRPGILNVKVVKDFTPNAYVFSNGSLFITTGLLSTINSEAELIAILAHEVSHFVLDHSVININKATQRQKNAEFWAAFATIAAATGEAYIASKNSYYQPGAITMGTAVIAQNIANSVLDRMGLKYSREQEIEADKCAVELMKYNGVNPLALSSALNKIKNYCVLTGNYLALSGEGTHPAMDERINEIGTPTLFYDIQYDRKISFVNTFNAVAELENQHFTSCINLAKRNINSNVATEDDYVLMAIATLNMYDNEQKNLEALSLIITAKSLKIYPSIDILKQEVIVLIRLKRLPEAKLGLQKYKEELDKEKLNLSKIVDTRECSATNMYIIKEYEWTVKMISKVDKL
ncbi:MAG: M48 family metallopeptidase [Paludibacter sp.]